MLGNCCPLFFSGAISLSQVDVTFKVLDLSVVDIHCMSFSIPTSLACQSSDPDFYFHQLIPVAFAVVQVVY